MAGVLDAAVKKAVNESIQSAIQKSINDAIKTGITKSVSDAVSTSIQKGVREQIQKGVLKNTDDVLKKNLNDTLKKSLTDNKDVLRSSDNLTQYFTSGQLNAQNFSKLIDDFEIPKSVTDDLADATKKAGKDMAQVPTKLVDEAENLRKGVGEGNIKGDGIVDLNKATDDINVDPKFNTKANSKAEAKVQAEDFIKKNGNKRYKTAAGLILGSVLAAYVYNSMAGKMEARGIRNIEKVGDKELKITYAGESFDFCEKDVVNITIQPPTIVTTQSGGVNGDYENFNDLKNNQVKIPTTSNITTTPTSPAAENQNYGQIKVNSSFLNETTCVIKKGITGLLNAAGDITGLSGFFKAIKKFIPWIVGIIILIILFKVWSYFKSSSSSVKYY